MADCTVTPDDQCNYCAGPIRWLTTNAGKRMPVDANPDPVHGNVVRVGGIAAVLGRQPAAAARAQGVDAYLHHAVTCPYAAQWNRKTRHPAGRRR